MFYCTRKKVKSFGKTKTKNVFLFLNTFFPCLFIVWGFIQNQELDAFKNINSCYALDHKVFLAELVKATPGKHLFCVFDKIDGKNEYIFPLIGYITCMTKQVILILLGMNVFEGLIYYKIFSHITRYDFKLLNSPYVCNLSIKAYWLFHLFSLYLCREHEEMMTRLKKMLVKSSKIRRNRRKLLNIQIPNFCMVGRILFWINFCRSSVTTEAYHFIGCNRPLHKFHLLGGHTRHLFDK